MHDERVMTMHFHAGLEFYEVCQGISVQQDLDELWEHFCAGLLDWEQYLQQLASLPAL